MTGEERPDRVVIDPDSVTLSRPRMAFMFPMRGKQGELLGYAVTTSERHPLRERVGRFYTIHGPTKEEHDMQHARAKAYLDGVSIGLAALYEIELAKQKKGNG